MAVTAAPEATIAAGLEAYRRRVRRHRRWRYGAGAILGVAALWLIAAVGTLLGLAIPYLGGGLLVATGGLPLGALLVEVVRRPSLGEVAATLDRRMDDRQRLETAVEILAAHTETRLTPAQLGTTAALLAAADPRGVYPARVPWATIWASISLACLALALFLLRGLPDGVSPLTAGAFPAAMLSPAPVEGAAATSTPAPRPTNAAQRAAASRDAQAALERLARALSEQSVTQQPADSLRQGAYDLAAQQITDVGVQSDQLSDEAKIGLSDSLGRAADDTAGVPLLQTAELRAHNALASGQYKLIVEGMAVLGEAVRQLARQIIPQQELAQQFPSPTAPAMASPDAQGTKTQAEERVSQSNNSVTSDITGTPSPISGQAVAADATTTPPGGGPAPPNATPTPEAQAPDPAASPRPGEGPGPAAVPTTEGSVRQTEEQAADPDNPNGGGQGGNDASRVTGPADTSDLDVAGNPFEVQPNTDPQRTPPPDQTRAGDAPPTPPALTIEGSGPADTSGAGSATGAPNTGTTTGERNHLPVERWDVVRHYFSRDE